MQVQTINYRTLLKLSVKQGKKIRKGLETIIHQVF
jgi:hypothetical protein